MTTIVNQQQVEVSIIITREQVQVLKRAYIRNSRPSYEERRQLAEEIGIDSIKVKIWFQNRRFRDKKREAKRIRNMPLSSRQLQILKSHFKTINGRRILLSSEEVEQLSVKTGLTTKQIRYWFWNGLPEDKKTEKTSETISPNTSHLRGIVTFLPNLLIRGLRSSIKLICGCVKHDIEK